MVLQQQGQKIIKVVYAASDDTVSDITHWKIDTSRHFLLLTERSIQQLLCSGNVQWKITKKKYERFVLFWRQNLIP